MQPYLFPYIGYWQLVNSVDEFVIMEDLNYIKQGFINRNYILVHGEAHRFTMELHGASQNKLINEIDIGNNREKIIKTIEVTYSNAPYSTDVFPLIKYIMQYPENNLARFISNSIEQISDYLGINTTIIRSSDIKRNHQLKAQDMVLDICKQLHTTCYINSIGGQKLYSKDIFKEHGLELFFIKTNSVEYKQFNNAFVPNLSIIDVMMFNSKVALKDMLNKYVLI